MLKKVGIVGAVMAASAFFFGGMASASPAQQDDYPNSSVSDEAEQSGVLNLNNTDVLHNVDAVLGVCDNNINIIAIQAYLEDVLNNPQIPILSKGTNKAKDQDPENCASGGIKDGGTAQGN
ncbi:hypothetical protein [Amycolatopsis anabasis]|uniref:hypothetical protein n=1 Tax=Amycolatopsis anabasis TaxID=1840409 RepID=UPI00131DD64D|nr:hypothetical protein [Amycolatopsis anabasis]